MRATLTKIAMIGGLMVATLSSAQAGNYSRHADYDYADVVDVQPVYHVVQTPTRNRECWDEQVVHRVGHDESPAGMLVGGIVGGVLGNQFGAGHGRQAMTVAGTLLGGAIGRDMTRSRDDGPRSYATTEERCAVRTDYVEEERLSGYKVTYRYGDRVYTRTMDHDPGRRLRVNVTVTPAE